MKYINLDEAVVNALRLFQKEKIPALTLSKKRCLIVGSGNAAVTGRILFSDKDVVFGDEGNYLRKIKATNVDTAVLISASGGKNAPIIAQTLKKKKISTTLLTTKEQTLTHKFVQKVYVFPKNPEPYTYNTSSYLGMILGKTREDPSKILNNLKKIKIAKDLGKYDAYYLIVPTEFESMREMFQTKFDELFGPIVSGRVFTPEQTKHAKTVVGSTKELFISFGYRNKDFGLPKNRIHIALPEGTKEAGMMALGYYVIGKIQKAHPPYFERNIEAYTKKISKLFKQTINPIVE